MSGLIWNTNNPIGDGCYYPYLGNTYAYGIKLEEPLYPNIHRWTWKKPSIMIKDENITDAVDEVVDKLINRQKEIDASKPIPKPADPVKFVQFNYQKGATTIAWNDGTYTTVRCQNGEPFDEEKAIALCFMKKAFDNRGCYNDFMHDYMVDAKQVGPIYTDKDDTFESTSKARGHKSIEDGRLTEDVWRDMFDGADEDSMSQLTDSELADVFHSDDEE